MRGHKPGILTAAKRITGSNHLSRSDTLRDNQVVRETGEGQSMAPKQPIPVSCVWEEHSYLSEQQCTCGGHYTWLKWELHFEKEQQLEVAYAKCIPCETETKFWFEVSAVFEKQSRDATGVRLPWPAPHDGPSRTNEKKYLKTADCLIAEPKASGYSQQSRVQSSLKAVESIIDRSLSNEYCTAV